MISPASRRERLNLNNVPATGTRIIIVGSHFLYRSRILLLLLAIVVTAIGASLTVGMEIVPNPADGLANIIGTSLGHGFGFGKNLLDGISIAVSLAIGFLFTGSPLSIGAGTIISMILTGRVIALLEGRVRKILEWTQR